ncbi:hypothetical protein [Sphingomonas phyllosphaerae]|uniref:hypothetical protein n=1 Tax=Sphingomonas phyllosphaerae TaxID=257003 RepID=UPI0012DC4788|nr:hypothetical protein [Sphingomonas phyllosphaerae]
MKHLGSADLPAKGFYKFVEHKRLDDVASGVFAFGSLYYYRLLEYLSGSRFIGDANEGVTSHQFPSIHVDNSEKRALALEQGVFVDEKSNASISITHINEDNGFVLSLAYGRLADLAPVFAAEHDGYPGYNSAVRISDIEAFTKLLPEAQIIFPSELSGKTVGQVCSQIGHRGVSYESASFVGLHRDARYGSAFIKNPFFEEQAEYRIRLSNDSHIDVDRLVIRMPHEAEKLIEIVLRGADSPTKLGSSENLADLLREFNDVVVRLQRPPNKHWEFAAHVTAYDTHGIDRIVKEKFRASYHRRMLAAYWNERTSAPQSRSFEDALKEGEWRSIVFYYRPL